MQKKLLKCVYGSVVAGLLLYSGIRIAGKVFSPPTFCVSADDRKNVFGQINAALQLSVNQSAVFRSNNYIVSFSENGLVARVEGVGFLTDVYSGEQISGRPYCVTEYSRRSSGQSMHEKVCFRYDSFETFMAEFDGDGLVDLIGRNYFAEDDGKKARTSPPLTRHSSVNVELFLFADRRLAEVKNGLHIDDLAEEWRRICKKR